MRLKVSLILGCIILSLIPSSAFGAVKAGAKCSKAGQISISAGKQYTCLKKGKKLAWSAGKTITQAAPKPSATPTPTPTPEPSPSSPANTNPSPSSTPVPQPQPSKLVSANALAVQALFDEVWKRDTKSKAKYEIFIDPSRPNSKWAQEHVAFIETTLELLAKMGYDLKTSSKIYIGWDWQWMQKFMPRNSWCYEGSWAGAGYCGEGINFVNLKHTGDWLRTGGQEIDWPSPEVRMAATTMLPHELGHQAQGELSELTPGRNISIYPAWLREGGMNLLKTVVYARINKMSYVDARELFFKMTDIGCAQVPLLEMLMSENHPKNCNYTGGFVASEALIALDKNTSALFRFGASKIALFGPKFNEERKGISIETYRSIMKEIYNIDIDQWHPIVEAEIKIWTP